MDHEALLEMEDVEKMISFGKSQISVWRADGLFPEGETYGRARRWKLSEIQDWIKNNRIAKRCGKVAA